ncbi:MAG: hypothetical protein R3F31_03735 [Verrucomicrobiales bacterium]
MTANGAGLAGRGLMETELPVGIGGAVGTVDFNRWPIAVVAPPTAEPTAPAKACVPVPMKTVPWLPAPVDGTGERSRGEIEVRRGHHVQSVRIDAQAAGFAIAAAMAPRVPLFWRPRRKVMSPVAALKRVGALCKPGRR